MTRYLEVAKATIREHQPYKASEMHGVLQILHNRIPGHIDLKAHVPISDLVKWNVGHSVPVGF